MSNFEAKSYYQDRGVAQKYDSQFRSPLRLSNLRAKLIGSGEMRAFSRLLKHAPAGGSVLDVACGTGRYTQLLLSRGYQVGGIDISSEMLAIARARINNDPDLLFMLNGDAENLPFEDKQFDGVTCMRLFHRIPPTARLQMLREVKRVARKWAILFFGMSTPWLSVRRAVRSKLLAGRPSNPYPISPAEMRDELQAAGFTLRDCAWVLPYVAEGMVIFVNC